MKPETRYARSGGVHIAYQVVGNGPRDLVFVPGWVSNVDMFWEHPTVAGFLTRLASFSRLILFDKRGTGLSDRVADLPNLETRMDDVRAVMDAVGSQRAAVAGYSEGGPLCALFAATYPERTSALIMLGSYARMKRAPEHPFGREPAAQEAWLATIEREWGGPVGIEMRQPSAVRDPTMIDWWARFLRQSASPAAAAALTKMNYEIDVRDVLPLLRVPTLIAHSVGDRTSLVGAARYLAEHIAGAKYVELPGADHLPWGEDAEAILVAVEQFLSGVGQPLEVDRVLATVLFTDIVDSTRKVTELGDRRWRDLLASHHDVVRGELGRFRGRELDTAGDGVLAAFDGPARAVRAACSIADGVRRIGVDIRAGVHTGECELLGNKLAGIAVHVGARIASVAEPGEVVVSGTVKDLVAGSGLKFRERGVHELKGVPGVWQLYSAAKD